VGVVFLGGEVVFVVWVLAAFGFSEDVPVEASERGARGAEDDCVALG
jgi:hypothetical protein